MMNLHNTEKTSAQECSDITVLYPGGFKPITGAHIDLINKYLSHPRVKQVVLFISPNIRDGIDSEVALNIADTLFLGEDVEVILDDDSYSPILAVYRWIEKSERNPGYYALASSSKDDDYKRVKEFTKNYSPEKFGKNLPKGVKVIELPLDVNPLTYQNGEPISASNARKALKNNDYKEFKKNYPNIKNYHIEFIWKTLKAQ